jgi:hypothetical protein
MDRRSAFGLAGAITAALVGIGGLALHEARGHADAAAAAAAADASAFATGGAAADGGASSSGFAPDADFGPAHATTRTS